MSNNGWNSEYNSAKGALLVGNATRPVVRTVGADGFVLTANSANADGVEWAVAGSGAFSQINNQVFTANGTYTPTVGMLYCQVIVLGGGGAGGGSTATGVGAYSAGAGGGSGEYAVGIFDAVTIGASQVVTIGAAGVGVSGATGGNGGTTSLGALITGGGGAGGDIGPGASANFHSDGGNGGSGGAGGDYRAEGRRGENGYGIFVSLIRIGGAGAPSELGAGGRSRTLTNNPGETAGPYGSGGGGALSQASAVAKVGGNGSAGIIIVTEYIG